MGYSGPQLQSPPVRLHWYGFTGDTFSMQRAGWQFQLYKDHARFSDIVAFHHPKLKTYAKFMVDDVWRHMRDSRDNYMDVNVECSIGGDLVVSMYKEHTVNFSFSDNFTPLDMTPQWVDYYVSKHNLFREDTSPKNKIIVPDDPSVDELLDKLLKLQQPNQVKYFEDKVRNKELITPKMTGQIIQLRA